jgi:glutathione S-transferase
MESKKLVLMGDYGSQPTRAVYCLLTINKVPFDFKEVRVLKMEQYSEEFKKVNPNAKVPAITDGDVNLFESHTILRYLHETRGLPDHWYPKDPRKRAKVNEYLDWHHNGLRLGAGGYLFRKYLSPLTGKPAPKEAIQESVVIFQRALSLMEKYWLESTPYLNGTEPSIADLSAACELAQTNAIPFFDDYPKKYPKVYAWLKRMLEIPEMKQIHEKVIPGLRKFFKSRDEEEKNEAKL